MRILRHRVEEPGAQPLPDTAAVARAVLHGRPAAFWLDGGADATAGVSYLGVGAETLTSSPDDGRVTSDLRGALPGTILDLLADSPRIEPEAGGGGVPLGWVGWFGYGLGEQTTGVRVRRAGAGTPECALMRVDRVIARDHGARETHLLAIGEAWSGELLAWRERTERLIRSPPSREQLVPPIDDARPGRGGVRWTDSDDAYLAQIATCLEAIREGDAYQLCLTTEATGAFHGDPFDAYLALRRSSPTHHGGLLRIGDVTLLSASPERFLSVTPDGVVETHPIKGTRPRGDTAAEDRALARELADDEKERAENLMIVDLMRNDLGRVCAPGSIEVPSLFEVESYAHVHQLVSRVRGVLADGRSGIDALAACFPAGSMTGAPKIRAMQLLDEVEDRARGVYSGAFGWVGCDGSVELAMVIRSILLTGSVATVGSGGGITASSAPARELAEVKLKAAALIGVLTGDDASGGHPRL